MRYLIFLILLTASACNPDAGCYTCTTTTTDTFSPALGGGTETSTLISETCSHDLADAYNDGEYDTQYNSPDLKSTTRTRCRRK